MSSHFRGNEVPVGSTLVSGHSGQPVSFAAFQHLVALYERTGLKVRRALSISANERLVLVHMLDAGPLTAADLSRWVGMTTAAMAGLIDRLERNELIIRKRDPRDARRILLYPSKKLISTVMECSEPMAQQFDAAVSRLSPEERRGAMRLFEVLAEIFERELDPAS